MHTTLTDPTRTGIPERGTTRTTGRGRSRCFTTLGWVSLTFLLAFGLLGSLTGTADAQSPISITKSGTGSGTVTSSVGGIDCGATCTSTGITGGAGVTLTAMPSAGSSLTAWSGGCTGTSPTCVMTMGPELGVSATITSTANPTAIAVNPAGTRLYVANYNGASLSIYNAATTAKITDVSIGTQPRGVAISPDGTQAYVTYFTGVTDQYAVKVVDANTTTNAVLATIIIPVGKGTNPLGLAVNSTGVTVYVANSGNSNVGTQTISVIDTASNTLTDTWNFGSYTSSIALNPAGTRLYVPGWGTNSVQVVNTATKQLVATIPMGGSHPWGIAAHPDGSKVYVGNNGSNTVSVISTTTNAVTGTITLPAGSYPGELAINTAGTRLYVGNTNSTVSVIDTGTNAVVNTVSTAGSDTAGIAVNPVGTQVYTANRNGNSIKILGPVVVTVNAQIDLPPVPTLTSITPTRGTTGSAALPVTATGTGFVNGASQIAVNGTTLATTCSNSSTCSATIPSASLTSATTLTVTVVTAPPGGGTSTGKSFRVVTPLTNEILNDGPQGYWKLDETTGTTATDWSGNNRNGTYSGTYALGQAGINGNAVGLTAPSGQVAISGYTTMLPQFTFSSWIKMTAYPGAGKLGVILDKTSNYAYSYSDWPYYMFINSGGSAGLMVSKGVDYSTNIYAMSGSPVPLDGNWHQIVGTFNGQTATIYIDGGQVGTGAFASPITFPGNSRPYTIGHASYEYGGGVNTTGFTGKISDTAIYGSVLTAARIKAQFCASSPQACPGAAVVTSLSPTIGILNAPDTTVTITGSNLASTAVVKWGSVTGTTLSSTWVSPTQMTAVVPVALLSAGTGTQNIYVTNPGVGGGSSAGTPFTVADPVTTVTSLSPTSVLVGSSATTLIVNGTNFLNTSVVTVDGVTVTTTPVSGTRLDASLLSSTFTTPGTRAIGVTTPGVGTSTTQLLTVAADVPVLTSVSPSQIPQGSDITTITATGSGFASTSTMLVNGTTYAPQVVSGTTLRLDVPASAFTTLGTVPVQIVTPAPGGGSSASINLTIVPGVPVTGSLSPNSIVTGSGDTTVAIIGSGFVPTSVVYLGPDPLTTTYISATEIRATIPAAQLTAITTLDLTVATPAPGGGVSGIQHLAIVAPAPTLAGLSWTSIAQGSADTLIVATGTGFLPTSLLRIDGVPIATTVNSSTELQATLSAAALATSGTLSLTISTPAPGGGTSAALMVSVTAPAPVLTSITPATVLLNSPSTMLILAGTGFQSAATVSVGGTTYVPTRISDSELRVTVSAAQLTLLGTLPVSVTMPPPGGGTSASQSLSIVTPAPVLSGISPTHVLVGSATTTITATGSGFADTITLLAVNGTPLSTSCGSGSSCTIIIPATSLVTPGTLNITAINPEPGGGVSSAQTFSIQNPAPTLASISPTSALIAASATTLTATGSGFVAGSTLRWNGSDLSTVVGSSTSLTATIPTANLTTAGTFSLAVYTPATGGSGTSSSQTFTVNYPVPTVTGVSPSFWTAPQSGPFVLTISGTNFLAGTVAKWGNGSFPTTIIDATTLTMTLPGNTVWEGLMGGYAGSVTVVNPTPGGGTSNIVLEPVALPPVSLTNIAPASILLNGSGNITLNGHNFPCFYYNGNCPGAHSDYYGPPVVKVNGTAITATWVSDTQMTATIPSAYLGTAGTLTITVANPTLADRNPSDPAYTGMGYGSMDSLDIQVANPVPTLTTLSPTTLPAGNPAFELRATGTNFVLTSVLMWNATALPTTYYSATDVRATVDASLIAAGAVAVTVASPAPGGGSSGTQTFTVGPAATPTITSVTPNPVTTGSESTTLTVTGGGYLVTSTILLNGNPVSTTYGDSTSLQAVLGPEYWANAGTVSIMVSNPPPATAQSTASTLTIANPSPVLTAVTPTSVAEGAAPITLTVTGSNFINNAAPSVARWNGTALATTVIDGTTLQATVPGSLVSIQGTATITVTTAGPGGGTSASRSVDVLAPVPTITSISPTTVMADATNITLEVHGTGFQPTSKLNWGPWSNWMTPIYQDSTTLRFAMGGGGFYAFQLPGYVAPVSISTPAPGGGTSNTVYMGTLYPSVSLTSISPATTALNGSGAITLNGTNFRCVYNGSSCFFGDPTAQTTTIVRVNGTALSASWVNGTTMTATIPSSYLTTAGMLTVSVENPDTGSFGGKSTDFLSFTVENPVPTVTSSSPTTAQAGSDAFRLNVTGTNFVSTSSITWNSETLLTIYDSPTQLHATVPAERLFLGDVAVGVTSPAPGGGSAGTVTFRVSDPTVPAITTIVPTSVPVGSGSQTLTVTGTSFRDGASLQWNGVAVTTETVDNATLRATLDSSYWVNARTVPITVSNPFPATATSPSVSVSIVNPSPVLASVTPVRVGAGSGDLSLTATGSEFVNNSTPSTLYWNNTALSTSYTDGETLVAVVPSSLLRAPGVATLTVRTAGPGGGTSSGQAFTVEAALPVITSVSPATVQAGTASVIFTVAGAGFQPTSTISWRGTTLPTVYVDEGTLRATISANSTWGFLVGGYAGEVRVSTPAPGGGTSTPELVGVTLPPVTLTALTPTFTVVGGAGTVTLTGTNFRCIYNGGSCTDGNAAMTTGTTVTIDGTPAVVTWSSSTQLTATIPTNLRATARSLTIAVTNPDVSGFGGGSTATQVFEVRNPAPSISALSPTSMPAGGDSFTLVITGTGFVQDSTAAWNGTAVPTTFISATEIHATIASDRLVAGGVAITVVSGTPGGGTSAASPFTVGLPISLTITSMAPTSVPVGSGLVSLTLHGTGFRSTSSIAWGGVAMPTEYVDETTLRSTLSASYWLDARQVNVTVANPAPNAGTSAPIVLSIENPQPTLVAMTPTSVLMNAGDQTLTITGTSFVNNAAATRVLWNGTALATTVLSTTSLTAVVPAAQLRAPASVPVLVENPGPGGGDTVSQTFLVLAPVPVLGSVSPTAIQSGSTTTRVALTGSQFLASTIAQRDGVPIVTVYLSDTRIDAYIPTEDLRTARVASLTVSTPTPGGGQSSALSFTVGSPVPTLASIVPFSVPVGSGATALVFTGTGFAAASQIIWNGNAVSTQYVSNTELRVTLDASAWVTAEVVSAAVSTPAPGGGISASASVNITNPSPTLSAITPTQATAGYASATLTVTGSGFIGGSKPSVVRWTGTALATTLVNASTLTAVVPSGFLLTAQTAWITVTNDSPGGGTSDALPFAVQGVAPILTGISPNALAMGMPDTQITVSGSAFLPTSLVIVDGTPVSTRFIGAAQLAASVPAAVAATPGTHLVAVSTPPPGGGVSDPLSLTIQSAPVLQVGAPTQLGTRVAIPFGWPDGVTAPKVDCGTVPSQVVTGASGQCVYSVAGAYSLSGQIGQSPNVLAVLPQTGTVPRVAPSSLLLRAVQAGGAAVTTDTSRTVPTAQMGRPAAYPVDVTLQVESLRPVPDRVGILDPLDPMQSRVAYRQVATQADLSNPWSGTEPTLVFQGVTTPGILPVRGSLSSFVPCTLVPSTVLTRFRVQGVTTQGLPLSGELYLQGPVGDGSTIVFSTNRTDPPYAYPPAQYRYTVPTINTLTANEPIQYAWSATQNGNTVASGSGGTFIPTFPTEDPATVTLTLGGPFAGSVTWTDTVSLLSPPANDVVTFAITAPPYVSVPAPYTITPIWPRLVAGETIAGTPTWTVNGIPAGAATALAYTFTTPGTHTVAVSMITSASRTFAGATTITVYAPDTFTIGTLIQRGALVGVPVVWNGTPSSPRIECGTPTAQVLTGASIECQYSAAGPFTIRGTSGEAPTLLQTAPTIVQVPHVAPSAVRIEVLQGSGLPVTVNRSGTVPVFTMPTPTTFPVPISLQVIADRPAGSGVGVLDTLDLNTTALQWRQVAQTADLTAAPGSAAMAGLIAGPTLDVLNGSASLFSYVPYGPDPAKTRTRFMLTAKTLSGEAGHADAYLDLPVADGSAITLTVRRTDPFVIYAPTTYQYQVASLTSATTREPLRYSWTVSQNGTALLGPVVNTPLSLPVATPGTFSVTVTASGMFAGSRTWTDTVVVPETPPTAPVVFDIAAPTPNRPPALYRLTPTWPTLQAQEAVMGDPEWTVDGVALGAVPILQHTFTTPGPHSISLTAVTSLGRTLSGSTAIEVVPNQLPTAGIDCSGSVVDRSVTPPRYTLRCQAVDVTDPDGKVVALSWSLPNGGMPTSGTKYFVTYSTPVPVDLAALMVVPSGLGVADPLNTAQTQFSAAPATGAVAHVPVGGADPVYTGKTSLGPGVYTITLQGATGTGQAVNATTDLTILEETLSLITGTPTQDGPNMVVAVAWPPVSGITGQVVNCGTTVAQTFTGSSGSCVYSTGGVYTIEGRFTDSLGTTGIHTAPASVTIAGSGLEPEGVTVQILDRAVTQFSAYSFPVPAMISGRFNAGQSLGARDILAPGAVTVTLSRGGTTDRVVPATQVTAFTASAQAQFPAPGEYTVLVQGTTVSGATVQQQTTVVIDQATVALDRDTLTQRDLSTVALPLTWPSKDGVTPQSIDCGTTHSQTLSGTGGSCTYTQAGRYTVVGRFSDSLGASGLQTIPLEITVPVAPPAGVHLLAAPANGVAPSHNLTGTVPIATYGAPTKYPVPVSVTLTLDPPESGQVGILDQMDPSSARITIKPVGSAADLTGPVTPAAGGMGKQIADLQSWTLTPMDATHLTATGSLANFVVNQDAPATWRQRFVLTGRTLTGEPLATELYLDGPKGDGSQVQYTVQRIDPVYPYAPTSYEYKVTALTSPVQGEPLAHTWTVTNNAATTIQGNGSFTAVFTAAGQKAAAAQVSGPLSGAAAWTDPNPPVILSAPTGAIVVAITPPASNRNRPPASYSFRPNYPPLNPGEKLQGSPTWVADNNPATSRTGTSYTYAFLTPGAHSVTVTQPTTQRVLTGSANVTVNENQAPTGSIDCASSYKINAGSFVVACKAVNAKDPDGVLKGMTWALPDLGITRAGSTYWNYGLSGPAQLVVVTLTLTDDSGATTVLTTTVDFRATP